MATYSGYLLTGVPDNANANQLLVASGLTSSGTFTLISTLAYTYPTKTTAFSIDESRWYAVAFKDSATNWQTPYSAAIDGAQILKNIPNLAITSSYDGISYSTPQDVYDRGNLTNSQVAESDVSYAIGVSRAYIDLKMSTHSINRYNAFSTSVAQRKFNASLKLLKDVEINYALSLVYKNLSDDVIMTNLTSSIPQITSSGVSANISSANSSGVATGSSLGSSSGVATGSSSSNASGLSIGSSSANSSGVSLATSSGTASGVSTGTSTSTSTSSGIAFSIGQSSISTNYSTSSSNSSNSSSNFSNSLSNSSGSNGSTSVSSNNGSNGSNSISSNSSSNGSNSTGSNSSSNGSNGSSNGSSSSATWEQTMARNLEVARYFDILSERYGNYANGLLNTLLPNYVPLRYSENGTGWRQEFITFTTDGAAQ